VRDEPDRVGEQVEESDGSVRSARWMGWSSREWGGGSRGRELFYITCHILPAG